MPISILRETCARWLHILTGCLTSILRLIQASDDTLALARIKAPKIIEMLEQDNFRALHSNLVPALCYILPERLLREGFHMVRLGAGPIVNVGEPVISRGIFANVKVLVEFKRAKFTIGFRMTSAGKLLTLNLSPAQFLSSPNAWKPPAYVQSAVVKEVDVNLGAFGSRVSGVLTLPSSGGRYPCVIMLSGSGPCDKDSSVGALKPFKDLALGLARFGVASLRFDKVTYAHGLRIKLLQKKFTLTDEYVPHALDALTKCLAHPNIMPDGVFVLGHSLGGLVASRLATIDSRITGCILLATPAQGVHQCLLRQLRYFADQDDPSDDSPKPILDEIQRQVDLADSPDLNLATPASNLPMGIGPAYWLDMRNYDSVEDCHRLQKPILIIQGGRDYQVTIDDDYRRFVDILGGKSGVHMRVYDKCNHLFVAGEGRPSPNEYQTAGNVEKDVIRDISRWITDSMT
ncbi:alpha/beta-hydrolase [Myriangium duriaei CBS 260.36]|uniref:Alpha/beta-hydrolase n=1 Tax=Myriangium duriaei CBS 260.36 TaxID=1168546 RepID=A0A9P4J1K6_9PEZI|nr:alpha/beta-hydrolase [Myriangium duriaei CBS 260.36]